MRVFIIRRRRNVVARINAVDVGQEDIARGPGDAHLVLQMQRQLKIVAPVAPVKPVVRQHRIVEEDTQALEIPVNAVQHDDVGRDHQKLRASSDSGSYSL